MNPKDLKEGELYHLTDRPDIKVRFIREEVNPGFRAKTWYIFNLKSIELPFSVEMVVQNIRPITKLSKLLEELV